MGTDFLSTQSVNKLNANDLNTISKYIFYYSNNIEKQYGSFNWEDSTFNNYVSSHKIKKKGTCKTSGCNYFWFEAKKGQKEVNDIAHHFLRHIRNSFAHGLVKKTTYDKKQVYNIDDRNWQGRQTMHGVIEPTLLWDMIELLSNTKENK